MCFHIFGQGMETKEKRNLLLWILLLLLLSQFEASSSKKKAGKPSKKKTRKTAKKKWVNLFEWFMMQQWTSLRRPTWRARNICWAETRASAISKAFLQSKSAGFRRPYSVCPPNYVLATSRSPVWFRSTAKNIFLPKHSGRRSRHKSHQEADIGLTEAQIDSTSIDQYLLQYSSIQYLPVSASIGL